jgi:hypothetical protein
MVAVRASAGGFDVSTADGLAASRIVLRELKRGLIRDLQRQ